MTWPLAFSRVLGSSLVFPVSFHWLPVIFCFALIGCWSYSGYGVRSLIEVRIERFETIAESYWNLKTMFILRQPGMFQFFYPLLTVTSRKSFPYRIVISCPVSHLRLRCRLIIRLRPEIIFEETSKCFKFIFLLIFSIQSWEILGYHCFPSFRQFCFSSRISSIN